MKTNLIKRLHDEKGQALIIVLVLLMLGGLLLPPVLSHIGTALKTGTVYQDKTEELYAADAGVEDAIWQIKYDRLTVLFTDPEYDIYDFGNTWSYDLEEPVNGLTANVTIQNIWMPKDLEPLDPALAKDIIESNKLMVAGTASGETGYKIKINFTPGAGEEDDLLVVSLGIWLPLGFSYNGSCTLEDDIGTDNYTESVTDYAGGQAVVWDFDPPVSFISFPGVNPLDVPMMTEITFEYTPSTAGATPVAIAWMTTDGVDDVPLSWDIDTRIYKITSVVGNTEIEAYSAKCELRKIGAAIAGDYRAVGNSLMQDNSWPYDKRDTLLSESSAEISDIPESADVVAAYLYWSGWFAEGELGTAISQDDFTTADNWTLGNSWVLESGHFKGHNGTGAYLTLTNSIDLSAYLSGPGVVIGWQHWEDGTLESADRLQYQYSYDGGDHWSGTYTAFSNDIGGTPISYTSDPIDDTYLTSGFKFRFYLADWSGGDDGYCYVDNFAIYPLVYTADTSVVFKINDTQVSFDAQGDPQTGGELTAGESQALANQPGQYSYACNRDVTRLVKTYSDLGEGENHTGNGAYTVGSVDADTGEYWSYAGWSIIIIYSSPETAGHQLYLYDTFAFNGGDENLDFDNDGEPGGDITGFFVPEPIAGEENAATLTVFIGEGDDIYDGDYLTFESTNLSDGAGDLDDVWDSQSVGMSEDGVDIDNFYITWASGLIEPGDITAHIDMPSQTDNWNLIYIILSMRSETVTGGTTHYVIRGN